MNKEYILSVVIDSVCLVVPEIKRTDINLTASLRDLGANSVDRAEILSCAVDRLNLQVSMVRLGIPETIQDIVNSLSAAA